MIQAQSPTNELSTLGNNISDISKPIAMQDNEGRSQVVMNV